MATNKKVPYGYGGPVTPPPSAPNAAPAETYTRCSRVGQIILACVIMFLGLGALTGGLLCMGAGRWHGEYKDRLEIKQLGDLQSGLNLIVSRKREQLQAPGMSALAGENFYGEAFRRGLLDKELLGKITSLNSKADTRAYWDFIDKQEAMPANTCSYTAPKAGELAELMQRRGADRTILITFNARNWKNYEKLGVLVLWSDAEVATYMTFDEAHDQYGITEDEWDDPKTLIGKKAPFDHTYE